jgi:hypothetical protein
LVPTVCPIIQKKPRVAFPRSDGTAADAEASAETACSGSVPGEGVRVSVSGGSFVKMIHDSGREDFSELPRPIPRRAMASSQKHFDRERLLMTKTS